MTVLTVLLGIILILGGVSCMSTPVTTFLAAGYFIGILFLVYGIGGIIKAFQKRSTVGEIILSVLATVLGVFSLFKPGTTGAIDKMLLLTVAIWFIVQGTVTIVIAFRRQEESKLRMGLALIIGVLSILLGIYSLIHQLIPALVVGYLIGIYFIESGVHMIILAFAARKLKKGLEEGFEAAREDAASYESDGDGGIE